MDKRQEEEDDKQSGRTVNGSALAGWVSVERVADRWDVQAFPIEGHDRRSFPFTVRPSCHICVLTASNAIRSVLTGGMAAMRLAMIRGGVGFLFRSFDTCMSV